MAIVRFEPSLNRAIDFAVGEGLVRRDAGSKFTLMPAGASAAAVIAEAQDVLVEEKQFLADIHGKVTQTQIDQVLQWEA